MSSKRRKKPEHSIKKGYPHLLDNLSKQLTRPLLSFALSKLLDQQVLSVKDFDREFDVIEVKKHYVDYLGRVKVVDSEHQERELLVHLEFQSRNDKNMRWRILEYAREINRKYGEYPFQVVVYLGEQKLSMESCFKKGLGNSFLHYCFEILDISSYTPEDFLKHDDPKMKLLAAFTLKSRDHRAKLVLEEIVKGVFEENNIEDRRHDFSLLEFLMKQKNLINELREVIKTFEVKLEDLPSYQEGRKEGLKEGIIKGEKKGLKEGAIKTIVRLMKKKYQLDKKQEQEVRRLLEKHSIKKLESIADLLITPITLEELLEKIKK